MRQRENQVCLRPRDRFWGLGCPKIYHKAEDTLEYRKTASAP
ncbi:hypothetical protein [Thiolapillus sp.]|nr:hypothetical protein [Thiolapillus sp.]